MSEAAEYDVLALRSREGDPKALAILYRRLGPPLLDYLERMLGERAEAEDILHDSFLRLFQGRGRYSGRGRFRPWLFTVATRLARDRLRQRRRHAELASTVRDVLVPGSPASPTDALSHRELLKRIDSALADLPATYATAFHLRVREGFPYREIASICGEPEGTLRSRVHHTLKQIRRTLRETASEMPQERQKEEDPR